MTRRNLAAVLWDMDGTIVDSEPYWMRAETELVERFGGTWTVEDGLITIGNDLDVTARTLQNRGVELGSEEIIDTLAHRVAELTAEQVRWRPGVQELLAKLVAQGVPNGLVTMSTGTVAHLVVSYLPEGTFSTVVTADDVVNGKPHPEPYLTAATRLGVDPRDCVAIEDSPTGLRSATAAGTVAVGVVAHLPLARSADYPIWDTLVGVGVGDLAELVRSREVRR